MNISRMKYALLTLVALILSVTHVSAQIKWNSAYQAYIDQYKDLAIEQMLKYNIPASITLSQGLLESGAGRSWLTKSSNNHFGIKCHGWTGRRVFHDDDERGECFRAYDNPRQSFEDHSRFLATQSRYARLFNYSRTDYKSWARGLKQCGYATNPQYASKLIQIIELYNLNQYDKAKKFDQFMVKHSTEDGVAPDGNFHVICDCTQGRLVPVAFKGAVYRQAQTRQIQRTVVQRGACCRRRYLSEEEAQEGDKGIQEPPAYRAEW